MAIAVLCIVVIELCWSVGLNTLVSTMKSWLQDQGFSNADSSSVHQNLAHSGMTRGPSDDVVAVQGGRVDAHVPLVDHDISQDF